MVEHQTITHLATAEDLVIRQVEDVDNKLGDGVATNPQEDSLAGFDEVQTMSLQTLRGEGQWGRHDDALLANGSTLENSLRIDYSQASIWRSPLEAYYAESRTSGRDTA